MRTYCLRISFPALAFLAALFIFYSCKDELSPSPTNAYDNANFWTNKTNATIALTGVYRGNISTVQTNDMNDFWSYSGLAFMDLATDNAYDRRGNNTGSSAILDLTNGTLLPTNTVIAALWKGAYIRITLANNFLEHIDAVPDTTQKSRMQAEVRFLRATSYFYLSQHFGAVPLVTKVLNSEEANQVSKETQANVEAYVTTELTAAASKLPRTKDLKANEAGRATRQAALAFLGRLQLAQKKYTEAIKTYQQIIDYGDNAIASDYKTLFNPVNIGSTENIFTINYIGGQFPNFLPQHTYPSVVGGWSFFCPLESLASCYDFNDGSAFSYSSPLWNPLNVAQNRDPRFAASFTWPNSTFSGKKIVCSPDSTKSVDQLTNGAKQATRTGYGLRKFFDETFAGSLITGYGGGYPVIRYAEVLLSYLEAQLEAGQPISQDLLNKTINKIRGRASVNMPLITETNPELLRPILRKERRIELAFEGIRWWDIKRWGIGGQALVGDFWGASFPGSKTTLNKPTGYTADPYSRWWVCKKAFRAGTDDKWPIPQTEQNINPNLR
jgi:starch-binding outer membrane protein, SusD/RagB family